MERGIGLKAYFKIINYKKLEQVEILMGRSHLFLDLTTELTTPAFPHFNSLFPFWRSLKLNQRDRVEFGLNAC